MPDAAAPRRRARSPGPASSTRRAVRCAPTRAAWRSASRSRARLLHAPDLLLLDEPFSGLDPQAAEALQARLAALRRRGHAIVLTTHDVERAAPIATRVGDPAPRAHRLGRGGAGRPAGGRGGVSARGRGARVMRARPRHPAQGPAHRVAHAREPRRASSSSASCSSSSSASRTTPRPRRPRRSRPRVLWATFVLHRAPRRPARLSPRARERLPRGACSPRRIDPAAIFVGKLGEHGRPARGDAGRGRAAGRALPPRRPPARAARAHARAPAREPRLRRARDALRRDRGRAPGPARSCCRSSCCRSSCRCSSAP